MSENMDDIQQETEFAMLLEQSLSKKTRLSPGDQITARILKISEEWVFLDIGTKGEGVLDKKELLDENGTFAIQEGDNITAWFTGSSHGEMKFTTRMGKGAAASSQLHDAYIAGIPVEGFIEKEIKGGYEVKIGSTIRGFCPFSGIGLRRGESESIIGTPLKFIITQYSENGRNIVLSNRLLIQKEQEIKKESLKAELKVGDVIKGQVSSLQKFGAFIDIGGIEGLVPMSEIAWGRISDASECLSVGDMVDVKIKALDWDSDRITLSIKEILSDPWDTAIDSLKIGEYRTGRVSRLAQFGAFVTLLPGIDGLIPVSKLGTGKKINHPREVLKEGAEIEVTVDSINKEDKRISLSLSQAKREAEEEGSAVAAFMSSAGESNSLGTFGDLLKKFNSR